MLQQLAPQLILFNGEVVTLEEDAPSATAVAVKDGCFLAVGTDAMTISLEGHPDKLDDFEELLGDAGIVELQRTGRVALPKLDRGAHLRAVNNPNTKGKVG